MLRKYKAAVLTSSDKCAAGLRADESGPLVVTRLTEAGFDVVAQELLPDDQSALSAQMLKWCDRGQVDLIVTTGGTGLGPRDCMPEATLAITDKLVPGISEAMRAHSMSITPRGMLSRSVSAIYLQTLIINLPGSPKAASENLDAILPCLPHALDMLCGTTGECAQKTHDD